MCKGPGCTEAYVGQTKQAEFKARFSQHRRPSSSEHQEDSADHDIPKDQDTSLM